MEDIQGDVIHVMRYNERFDDNHWGYDGAGKLQTNIFIRRSMEIRSQNTK